jgi:hypothetical protein
VNDTPAEGSKPKEPQQKHKRGKKRKKPRCEAHVQGHDNDEDEALAVNPARKGPRVAPRGPNVFYDMLKKPCPYHKTMVNHTLEQCDMLKKYYSRATMKEGEAKKDGGDGDTGDFPAVENVFLIFGGGQSWTCPTASANGSGTRSSPRKRLLLPTSTGRGTPSPSAACITRTQASTHCLLIQSSATRGSPRC